MNSQIEEKREEISRLCSRYHVRHLELFGSAAKDVGTAANDFDFLVEFEELPNGEHADTYFGLKEDLEELFGCPVDLVMPRAIKNQYFLQNIQSSRTVLYAA